MKSNREFYHGVMCALAVVKTLEDGTLFDEIVETMDGAALLKEARRSGKMRWSGLDRYIRRQWWALKQCEQEELRSCGPAPGASHDP